MKSITIKILSILILSGFCFTTFAGTRINEVWTCTVNEGKSIDDVKTANHKWVAYVNKEVKGGDIQSYVATAIVGKRGQFLYVDSFPSMESWTAEKAAMEKDAGKKLNEVLSKVATCKSNSLYSLEKS